MDKLLAPIEQELLARTKEKNSDIWTRRNLDRRLLSFDLSYAKTSIFASNPLNREPNVLEITRMTSRMYIGKTRGFVDEQENERRDEESSMYRNYRNLDKTKSNYSDNIETSQPYSINTLHLQNSYKAPQRFEGFAPRNSSLKVRSRFFQKGTHKSREMNFRSRNNNLATTRREVSTVKVHDTDDDKNAASHSRRRDIRLYMKKIHFAETARQYCSNSSLHGLRYIGDASLTLLEKVFWFMAFVAAVGSAGYFILHLYQKWTISPIIISMNPEPTGLDNIPFPSITVCNMNNVKRTEANRINKGNNKLDKLLLEDQCDFRNNTASEDEKFDSANWSNVLHFMINVSQPCTDLLTACQWRGNETDCEKIFNPTMTDEGMCCNFNSVHRKYLFFNPLQWPDLNITYPYTSIDWNPENGYPDSAPSDSLPFRPYGAGKYYGLTLVLDSERNQYYCSSTASIGFKMFLHNPVETPKIADFAFALSPGRETRIIIKPQIATADWSILRIPRNKRKCFFTSERKLRYYRTYTQKNCLLECEAIFTQRICQCVQYYMPKSKNTPICGKKDDQCATQARRVMERNLYDENIVVNDMNITEIPSCNCWPGCFEMNYESSISSSKLGTNFMVDEAYGKRSPEYFAENMAVVHLFFVDSQFPNYVKNELFGFIEFLSSTGGLLGLFMGFSFLSVAEIFYFATLRVWCRIRGRHGNREKSPINVLPFNQNKKFVYPFAQ